MRKHHAIGLARITWGGPLGKFFVEILREIDACEATADEALSLVESELSQSLADVRALRERVRVMKL